jgi:hypothetical protein
MKNINKELFRLLDSVEGNGSFVTSSISKFTSPGLKIEDIGELGFPLNAIQIKVMIETLISKLKNS